MLTLPQADRFVLAGARVPGRFLREKVPAAACDAEGSVLVDLQVAEGRIYAVLAAGARAAEGPKVDLAGRQVWPALVDMHTHIDKSQVISRIAGTGANFASARQAINDDRARHWNRDDIRARMDFSIRCAFVHGVGALRSHIDSYEGQAQPSWEVFAELRAHWKGRVELQATTSVPIDVYATDYGRQLADLAAATEGGVLGGVLRRSDDPIMHYIDNIAELLDLQFGLAKARGLRIDLHVDEVLNAADTHLPEVAKAVIRHGLEGRVVCGHCCSLAVLPEEKVQAILALCAEAGIGMVTLPTANMHLQDRAAGRTPRRRGVTLAHEIRAAGVPLAIASDNVRDTFYPYGDYDLLDIFRQALSIYHLEPIGEALDMLGPAPASMLGVEPLGTIASGAPASLIILNARTLLDAVCRPQADRVVLSAGRRVTDKLPQFGEGFA